MLAGIVRMHRYPLAAHTIASPIPVFPDVGSMTTPPAPAPSRPRASAPSTIARQIRSFSEPPGLYCSAFPKTRPRGVAASTRQISKSGVSPTRSSTLSTTRGCEGSGGRSVAPAAGARGTPGDRSARSGLLMAVSSDHVGRPLGPPLAAHAELDPALTDVGDRHRVEAALDRERQIE